MKNPYQTPESDVTSDNDSQQGQSELANRGTRFIAAFVDGIIGLVVAIPFWFISGTWSYISSGTTLPLAYTIAGGVYGFIAFCLVHFYFLNSNGQTVGKKLLNIRIIGIDDQLQGALPLLAKRYLPINVVSLIPLLGTLLILIDLLFIFRKDRRCVHDLIAGTKVVTC